MACIEAAVAPHGSDEPSPWVLRFAPLVRAGGEVLDLACGAGRHARLFAARGCRVEAVDIDAGLAAQFDAQSARLPGIRFRAFDLEGEPWPYPQRRFDAIVVTRYLYRPHWPHLVDSLADGGVLIIETFASGNERYGRPRDPRFLLQPFELAAAFAPRLHVLAFEDGVLHSPRPARIQRLCALRARDDDPERLPLEPSERADPR
ncbi:MAG TPA: class I SAM-dependent methyltransferase [Burkholderiaceae bacterium]